MNYSNELNLLMKEIKFTSSKILRSNPGGGYFVILGKYNGIDVILRTTPVSDSARIVRFKREYKASKILASFNSNAKSNIINFTEVIDVQESSSLCWSIRIYSKDQTLAINERYSQEVMHGYDTIRQKFINDNQIIISNIVKIVSSVQKIDCDIFNKPDNKNLFITRLEHNLENIDIEKIEKLLETNIDKSLKYYSQNIMEYCDKKNTRANMGDLIPPNIIVNRYKKVILYDYEWFCCDNYIIDYSSLWLFLWRYPKWQNTICENVLITEKDKVFFRMSIVRELISWYAGAFSIKESDELCHRITFYKGHIWLKYIIAAGESFEAMMEVRK